MTPPVNASSKPFVGNASSLKFMKMFCFEIKFIAAFWRSCFFTQIVCMITNVFEWIIWCTCVYFVFKDWEIWSSLAIFVDEVSSCCFASFFNFLLTFFHDNLDYLVKIEKLSLYKIDQKFVKLHQTFQQRNS